MKKKKLFRFSAFALSALMIINSFSMPVSALADDEVMVDEDQDLGEDDFEDYEDPVENETQQQEEPQEQKQQDQPQEQEQKQQDQPQEQEQKQPEQEQKQPEQEQKQPEQEQKQPEQKQLQAIVFPSVKFEINEGDGVPAGKTIEIRNPNGFDVTTTVAVTEIKDGIDFQIGSFPQSMGANATARIDVIPVQKGGAPAAGNYNATLSITASSGGSSMSAGQPVQVTVKKKDVMKSAPSNNSDSPNNEQKEVSEDDDDDDDEEEEQKKEAEEQQKKKEAEEQQQKKEAEEQKKKEEEEEEKKQQEEEDKKKQEEEKKKQEEEEVKKKEAEAEKEKEAAKKKQEEADAEKKKAEEKQKEADAEKEKAKKREEEASKSVVESLRVTPGDATVKAGGNVTFSAKVYGKNNPSQSVTWSVSGGGSGTKITGDGTLIVDANESASQLKVVAASTVNTSVTGDATVKITKDSKEVTKTITVAADPADGGQVAGSGSYKQGDNVTVTAVPNNNYKFTGWMLNGTSKVSDSNTYQFKMGEENASYVAKFQRVSCTVKVSVNHESRGKVSGGGTVEYGGSMKLKAETKDDNRFRGWRENDKIFSTDKEIKLSNITTDRNIEAVFDKKGYKVTVNKNIDAGGKISGDGTYNQGDTVKLNVSIADGYRFDGWYLNNQKVSNAMDYKIENLDRDLNFTAVFFKNGAKTYTITSGVAQQGKGGVISPQGTTTIAEGSTFTYVMAPGNGYKILAVAVDGKQVGAVSTYTFTNVNANHTIAVAFAPDSNAVVKQTMEKIITTQEAASIASAKLETGGSTDGRTSVVSESSGASNTPAAAAAPAVKKSGQTASSAQSSSSSGSSGSAAKSGSSSARQEMEPVIEETISVEELDKEEDGNIIGMDGAEDLTEDSSEDLTFATGIYATLGTTPEMARQMVDSGDDSLLLKTAYDDGYLKVNINNQFTGGSSLQELDMSNPLETNATIKNMNEFVKGVLSTDEKMYMFEGNEISLNLDVSPADPSEESKKQLDSVKGVKPVGYFDIAFMKSEQDVPELISELPVEMELVLRVPEEVKQKSGKLCVVREHNGTVDVLQDLDDDPDTVTFRTDRFSAYAFAYEGGKGAVNWLLTGIIAAVLVAILVTALVLVQKGRRVKARARRRNKEY